MEEVDAWTRKRERPNTGQRNGRVAVRTKSALNTEPERLKTNRKWPGKRRQSDQHSVCSLAGIFIMRIHIIWSTHGTYLEVLLICTICT